MKAKINHPALLTWIALNDALREADERLCKELLAVESKGRRRPTFLRRIYGRLNRVRALREVQDLLKGAR